MRLEDPPRERRRFELIALAMGAVIVATILGFFAVVIFSADEPTPPAAADTPTPTATATPSPVTEGVSLTRPVDLRSGPADDVAIVTRLAQTDAIHLIGRSEDGAWLVVGVEERPNTTGWVPADAVAGADLAALPVIAPPGATPVSGPATLSPDLPDLVLERAYARDNHLWVDILNQGVADARGDFAVSVDGGPEVVLDVKPGEPLRPGQRLEARVPGHYVQLRANVGVQLLARAARPEEDTDNNTWQGIVAPDVPNDVEILDAAVQAPDDHLVVTIRNNSPIPIAGTFTVSVRESPPSNTLLGRERVTVEVDSGATLDLDFEEITEIDLTRVRIILSTDAIDDAMIANNSYPR